MRRSLVLATDVHTPTIELARLAENHGFHRIWTTEYATRDAPVRALVLGLATTRLKVATGIAYAFTRLPLGAAAMAADIQIATRGRFTLGLGAGTRGMRSKFYGFDGFDHPAPRLAEYVDLLRAAWQADDGLSFEGRFYSARVPGFAANDELERYGPPPVYGSGLNRIMLKYAARAFDGVALHPVARYRPYLDRVVLPALKEGWEEGGRSGSLACWLIVAIHPEAEVARHRVRSNLAFYFSTPSYASVVEGTRWESVAGQIRQRFRQAGPDWSSLAELVPDEMVVDFALAGTPDEVSADLVDLQTELGERGCDEVVFQTVGVGISDEETIDNCRQIIKTLGST